MFSWLAPTTTMFSLFLCTYKLKTIILTHCSKIKAMIYIYILANYTKLDLIKNAPNGSEYY